MNHFKKHLNRYLLAIALLLPVAGTADVIDDVEDAMEFWENRNADKFAFWQEVLDALNGAEISDQLMEKVSQSWANANPGGRMYDTWREVYQTLTVAKALQDAPPVTEEQVPEVPEIPATDESEEEVPTLELVTEEEVPATEETEVEVPVAVIEAVEDTVDFWENRNADKFAYWQEILEALNGAEISDELMEKVSQAWTNANPGGRMYNTWKGVYEAFTALREVAEVEEVQQEEPPTLAAVEEEVGEPENVVDWEIPDVQPEDAPLDLVPQQSDENNNNPVQPAWFGPPEAVSPPPPAWFNPGGGYSSQWHEDGYAGWYTTQWGEEFSSGDTTEDRCDDSGVCSILVPRPEYPGVDCSIEQQKCQTTTNPDGIPDYTYHSYEDAAFTHPRWGAKMAWGEWGELPSDVRAAVVGIDLPSFDEIAAELGATATGYGFFPNSGTATYEGEAVGVFRPDLFGTVYGTKDDPSTADKNEYDDGGPRVSLTVDFDKGTIDGELTARMTAQRLGFGPPVRQSLGLEKGYRWHSAHSHFFECPDSTCAETYTAVRPSSKNDGDGTYVHGRIETTVSVDEMLRTPVVRWNGIRITGTDDFEGQGLYGEVIATCSVGSGDACIWSDATAAIRGYINHPRFVGSYGAAKCASDGTCPGFEMPALVPADIPDYKSWGPWDDLPLATQQAIADIPEAGTLLWKDADLPWSGLSNDKTTHIASSNAPTARQSHWSAHWRGTVNGVVNPALTGLENPKIQFTADFSNMQMTAGIYYNDQWDTANETWEGIPLDSASFDQDGLTGQWYDARVRWFTQNGQVETPYQQIEPHYSIVGEVQTPNVVGTYRADR